MFVRLFEHKLLFSAQFLWLFGSNFGSPGHLRIVENCLRLCAIIFWFICGWFENNSWIFARFFEDFLLLLVAFSTRQSILLPWFVISEWQLCLRCKWHWKQTLLAKWFRQAVWLPSSLFKSSLALTLAWHNREPPESYWVRSLDVFDGEFWPGFCAAKHDHPLQYLLFCLGLAQFTILSIFTIVQIDLNCANNLYISVNSHQLLLVQLYLNR